jgi:hypothetical protein
MFLYIEENEETAKSKSGLFAHREGRDHVAGHHPPSERRHSLQELYRCEILKSAVLSDASATVKRQCGERRCTVHEPPSICLSVTYNVHSE